MGTGKKVLACDLSLTGTAFAVLVFFIDKKGHKQVKIEEIVFVNNKDSKKSMGYRLNHIAEQLSQILERHPDIDEVVREKGFSRFPAVTQALFRVVGVVDHILYTHGFNKKCHEVSPTTVKKHVAGTGKASKDKVEEGVRKFLGDSQKDWNFKTDDESDAVAVGITFGLQKKFL